MAALQFSKEHVNTGAFLNEFKDVSELDGGTYGNAYFAHLGSDVFEASGSQLSFLAGGKGADIYDLKDFNGLVSVVENAGDSGGDQLFVSADLFRLDLNEDDSYAEDLQVFSVDNRHLVISSESLDQKIVIADGMNNFGDIETVNMIGEHSSLTLSSSLVFDHLLSSEHYLGNFSASEAGASDIANALDDVIHEAQLTSQIENNLASENLTWDESVEFINENIDNPQAIYVGAQLSDLNTEMLGVLVGVSTDTVNEYFTANGLDPAGLG